MIEKYVAQALSPRSQLGKETQSQASAWSRKPLRSCEPKTLFPFPETPGQTEAWVGDSGTPPSPGWQPASWLGYLLVPSGSHSRVNWELQQHQINQANWSNTAKAQKLNHHQNHHSLQKEGYHHYENLFSLTWTVNFHLFISPRTRNILKMAQNL